MAAEPRPTPSRSQETDSEPGTRERLIDVAEQLFAEHGIASTSLRRITAEADANLAAVNYHFGSKAGLIEAVYARRIRPLNEERIRRLEAAERAAGDGPPTLEVILDAFFGPIRRMCAEPDGGGRAFFRLMARANLEPTEEVYRAVYRQFAETGLRFHMAMVRALPHLTPAEIFVRFRFALGAAFFSFANALDPAKIGLPAEMHPPADADVLEDLVTFLAEGFRAPGGGK